MYLIREKFLGFGDDFDITDDSGRPVYHVDGKALSLRDRLVIETPEGTEVASVNRRMLAMRRTYSISLGGEQVAQMRRRFFSPFVDRYTIDIPGPDDLEVRGDLFDHEYVVERAGREIASVSKKWFTMRDTYAVRIVEGEDDLLVLAGALALDLAAAAEHEADRKSD